MTNEQKMLTFFNALSPEWQEHLLKYAENVSVYTGQIAKAQKALSDAVRMPIGEYNDT